MKFNETKAAQYKDQYKLTDAQIEFWRKSDYLPEILEDVNLVGEIAENFRALVVKTLHLSWIKKLGFENLGVIRRSDFIAYKKKPANISAWAIATIYEYLANIDKSSLNKDTPLRFIRENLPLIKGSRIGSILGFNGNGINYYCEKEWDSFATEPERNEAIYKLLNDAFREFDGELIIAH